MRKLRLNLEELAVESFDTDEARAARGTVLANDQYSYYCETDPECRTPGYASCAATRCDNRCSGDDYTDLCPVTTICTP